MFDSAVRDAAKDSSTRFRDEGLAATRRDRDRADDKAAKGASDGEASHQAAGRQSARTDSAAKAEAEVKRGHDRVAAENDDTRSDQRSALDALDRLLNGGFAGSALTAGPKAVAASPEKTGDDASTADAEAAVTLAVVPQDGEALDAKASAAAEKARGKVSLEVVHMETHFEPRSDAFVLVEGDSAAGASKAEPKIENPADTRTNRAAADQKGLDAAASAVRESAVKGLEVKGLEVKESDGKARAVPAPAVKEADGGADEVAKPEVKGLDAKARDVKARDAAFDQIAVGRERVDASLVAKAAAVADGKTAAIAASGAPAKDTAPAVAGGDQDAAQPKLRFDEALARLHTFQDRDSGAADGGDQRGRGARFAETGASRSAAGNAATAPSRPSMVPAAASDDLQQKTTPFASMTSQVAGRVIDSLGSSLASQVAPNSSPGEAYIRMTAGGAALKTLTIQLQPEALGRLDVSMRLVEGQLTLEIAATEAGTAKVLAEDREGLRKLLQHAGFSLDDTSITIVTREASAGGALRASATGDVGAPARSDAGSQTGAGTGSDSGSQRDSAANDGGSRQNQRRQTGDDTARNPGKPVSTYL